MKFVLVDRTFTKGTLKAFKSLEAYKCVNDGLVHDVFCKKLSSTNTFLFLCKVRHGQSMFSKALLRVWINISSSGEVNLAHCTCMAGLGEVCSHIGALLFYIMYVVQQKKQFSTDACTSSLCEWLPPTLKEVSFLPVHEIKFSHKAVPDMQSESAHGSSPIEQAKFLKRLNELGKASILSIIPEYSDKFIPTVNKITSTDFTLLFHDDYKKLHYHELIARCDSIFETIIVNQHDIKVIESSTRKQSLSNTWFKFINCC